MTWTLKADIPGPTNEVREHGAVGIGTKIYLCGGFLPNKFLGPVSDQTWEWDEPTDTWTALFHMPAGRAAHGCDTIAGKMYAAGGRNSTTIFNTLYEYNPATDTWASKATMPAVRSHAAAVAVGSKLYVFGGIDAVSGWTVHDSVYVWDSGTNAWSTLTSMPAERFAAGAAAVGTDIYVFGGEDSSSTFTDTVWVYDTLTDTWTTGLTSMPDTDVPFGMCVTRGTDIYMVGGQNAGRPIGNPTTSLFHVYDTLTDSWSLNDPLPENRWITTNAATPSYFYNVAGWSGNTTVNELYQWQASGATPGADQWHVGGAFW